MMQFLEFTLASIEHFLGVFFLIWLVGALIDSIIGSLANGVRK